MKLTITWKLLYIGLSDNKYALSCKEIIDYAVSLLKDTNDERIINLASCEINEKEYIASCLAELSQKEKSDYNIEKRKWRLMYVIKNMPSRKVNYIEGLIELGNIWVFLDFPSDSPHIFQGRNNSISPKEYYTLENFNKLYEEHLRWIEQEKKNLINM